MLLPNWLKGSLLVLFGAFLWGTLVVATKGAGHLEPLTVGTVRSGMSALGCFLGLLTIAPQTLKVDRRQLVFLLFYGGATCGFLYGGFTVALSVLSVATSEIIFFTFPLFTTLLGIVVLGERPSKMQIVACLLIIAGVAAMTGMSGDVPSNNIESSRYLLGLFAAGLSVAGMTTQSLAGRKNAEKNWMATPTLFAYAQLFGFFWMALCKTLTTGWGDLPDISASSWLLLSYMGFITTLMGYGAYNLGLRYISASTASMLASFEMITAVSLAALLLKEMPSSGEILGCCLIFAALVLSGRSASRQKTA